MKIFVRVDSGHAIGTGHVMRCLTLADALGHFFKDKDPEIIFLSRPHTGNIIEFIQKKGYEVISLSWPEFSGGKDEKSWLGTLQEKDALECLPIIHNADLLIIDHYSIDSIWENLIRSHVQKIFVIDDLANRHHNCDILLDQNFYLDKDTRYQGLIPEYCQIFTGPEYALLRPEFFEIAKDYSFSRDVKNILVFFGGVDIHHFTDITIKTLYKIMQSYHNDFSVKVIMGNSNPHYEYLQKKCKEFGFWSIKHVDNIADYMKWADLSIGAGGTTTWERAKLLLPSVVIAIADNQKRICSDSESLGLVKCAGFYDNFDSNVFENILKNILENGTKFFNKDNANKIASKFYEPMELCR